jgi:phytol kinase
MLLCGGDGLADVVGRRVKSAPIPWSPHKTLAGSISVLIGGWILAVAVLGAYTAASVFPGGLARYLPGISIISFAGAVVESLPLNDVDNLTVPLASVILGLFLFK